jgi:hypothetical protein
LVYCDTWKKFFPQYEKDENKIFDVSENYVLSPKLLRKKDIHETLFQDTPRKFTSKRSGSALGPKQVVSLKEPFCKGKVPTNCRKLLKNQS